jgi:hypothetical protein
MQYAPTALKINNLNLEGVATFEVFLFFLPQQNGITTCKLIVGQNPLLNGRIFLILPFCTPKIIPSKNGDKFGPLKLSPNICHHKIGDIFLGTIHS